MMAGILRITILTLAAFSWAIAREDEQWQNCDYFMAQTSMGWGVFAARNFASGEIVDVAPLYVLMKGGVSTVKNTVLDDFLFFRRQRIATTTKI